jgi:hypothetical protein
MIQYRLPTEVQYQVRRNRIRVPSKRRLHGRRKEAQPECELDLERKYGTR